MFDELIRTYKQLTRQKEDIEQQLKDLRLENNDNVLQHGSYVSAEGRIELRASSFRVAYDSKSVDAVLAVLWDTNPALAEILDKARKVTTVQATWAVR